MPDDLPALTRHALHADVRAPDDTPGKFEAVVLTYGIVDDYDTVFDAGVFSESLERRLPLITWAHSWSDVIGRWVDYIDTDETLTLMGELDDLDAVPRAKQAWAQLRSGTITDFSVGFRPHSDRKVEDVLHFTRATLDEAALVLRGAVPGTKLVSIQRAGGLIREVPVETLMALAKKIDAGEISQHEAQIAVDLAAGDQLVPDSAVEVVDEETAAPLQDPDDIDDALDAADDALETMGL